MTREDIIQHFMDVVAAVFRAEDVVRPQWEERLRACRGADKDTLSKAADGYLRAVSEEILSHYSDDQLQRLYPDTEGPQDIEPYDDF